ncbi:hypothetical protein [Sorangium sp. So ce394]|uniref:hypothetical protein n=1 Tax=Sorangium sp. So ce394 TaxID=3133310 RepID=UPI003F5C7C04
MLERSAKGSSVTVDHGSVAVRLVLLGRADEAERLERDLRDRIAVVAGVTPKVDVIAGLDASALEEVAASVRASSTPIDVAPKEPELALVQRELAASLGGAWPHAAGPLVAWRLRFPDNEPAVVEVVHVGPALGAPAADLLGRALSRELGAEVAVQDRAIAPEPIVAEPEGGWPWLQGARPALAWLGDVEVLHGCVEVPPSPGASLREGHRSAWARVDGRASAAVLLDNPPVT